MAKAKNKVIAGDYNGMPVQAVAGQTYIVTGWMKKVSIDNNTVESYELITDEHRKSAKSGIARGIVGGAILGPVGLLAGAASAKEKGIYQIAIQFKDGKKSLAEVDDNVYKQIVKNCF